MISILHFVAQLAREFVGYLARDFVAQCLSRPAQSRKFDSARFLTGRRQEDDQFVLYTFLSLPTFGDRFFFTHLHHFQATASLPRYPRDRASCSLDVSDTRKLLTNCGRDRNVLSVKTFLPVSPNPEGQYYSHRQRPPLLAHRY